MKFHLISLGSRPLLAVPGGAAGLWKAAIDCYPAHTPKKRLVRAVLRGLASLGLMGLLFPARKLSLPGVKEVDFEAWMGELCGQLALSELQPVLVWPADPARGRVYIHFLGANGERIGFGKLGLDEKNNACIDRERRALERLQGMQLKQSRVPKLLASGELGEFAYLVVETIPVDARATDWQSDPSIDANIAEYAGSGRMVSRVEIEATCWWPEICRAFADNATFMQEVDTALDQGTEVCLAHGDLNCTNVLRDEDEVWLLDWEQSDESAPVFTDQVCVAVDKLWLANPQDPAGNLHKFMEIFPDHKNSNTHAKLIMALAYLSAAGFPPALAMIQAMYPSA